MENAFYVKACEFKNQKKYTEAKKLLEMAIQACLRRGKYIGICGQGPSDYPDLAQWLMQQGIESISLNPDSVVETWLELARHDI